MLSSCVGVEAIEVLDLEGRLDWVQTHVEVIVRKLHSLNFVFSSISVIYEPYFCSNR